MYFFEDVCSDLHGFVMESCLGGAKIERLRETFDGFQLGCFGAFLGAHDGKAIFHGCLVGNAHLFVAVHAASIRSAICRIPWVVGFDVGFDVDSVRYLTSGLGLNVDSVRYLTHSISRHTLG